MRTVAASASCGRTGLLASMLTPEGTLAELTNDCTAQVVEIVVTGEAKVQAVVLLPLTEVQKLNRGRRPHYSQEDALEEDHSVSLLETSDGVTNAAFALEGEGEDFLEGVVPFDLMRDSSKFRILNSGEQEGRFVETVILSAIEKHVEETGALGKNPRVVDEICREVFGKTRAELAAADTGEHMPVVVYGRAPTEEELPDLLSCLPESWESVVRAAVRPAGEGSMVEMVRAFTGVELDLEWGSPHRGCQRKTWRRWAAAGGIAALCVVGGVGLYLKAAGKPLTATHSFSDQGSPELGSPELGSSESGSSELASMVTSSWKPGSTPVLTTGVWSTNEEWRPDVAHWNMTKKLAAEELMLLREPDNATCAHMWENGQGPVCETGRGAMMAQTENGEIICYYYGSPFKYDYNDVVGAFSRMDDGFTDARVMQHCRSGTETLQLLRREISQELRPGDGIGPNATLQAADALLEFKSDPKCTTSCTPPACETERFQNEIHNCTCRYATATCIVHEFSKNRRIDIADFYVSLKNLYSRARHHANGINDLKKCEFVCRN
ncbi:putative transmembrane protein [Gregarina niphandrodes]|uniref:Transmembrane protein n=1 Tax=Gregarina niphandrodes TaxID=110365 RepID=A0A023AY24_GRENI|nr:putative transmembrane protein [Gregarina niphandrodes]EZG43556.1 putative transmembrane protein [Gregarina niphandrodes]|eukprot:XP_011133215.1 putative transmembrane protein [Gregarina niphandrodes]